MRVKGRGWSSAAGTVPVQIPTQDRAVSHSLAAFHTNSSGTFQGKINAWETL